jgi:ATP-dependent Clp protease ATP-binding subunit ClpA
MFERFTNRARNAVVKAQEEARGLHHRHIGTEHLLLGILDAEGLAHLVLTEAGVEAEQVRADVQKHLRYGFDVFEAAEVEDLKLLGIDLDAVRAKVEKAFGPDAFAPRPPRKRGLFRWRTGGHIPFTPRARKILELSLREALALKHNYIGTEHILLGLLREGNGLAARILVDRGLDLADLRRKTIAAVERKAA